MLYHRAYNALKYFFCSATIVNAWLMHISNLGFQILYFGYNDVDIFFMLYIRSNVSNCNIIKLNKEVENTISSIRDLKI